MEVLKAIIRQACYIILMVAAGASLSWKLLPMALFIDFVGYLVNITTSKL